MDKCVQQKLCVENVITISPGAVLIRILISIITINDISGATFTRDKIQFHKQVQKKFFFALKHILNVSKVHGQIKLKNVSLNLILGLCFYIE